MFMPNLLIIDSFIEKKDYKQDIIGLGGPCYIKIDFTLLIEVIVAYIQFFII